MPKPDLQLFGHPLLGTYLLLLRTYSSKLCFIKIDGAAGSDIN